MAYFSINRVVLVGRLTRDPETRALPSGTSVCALRIACNGGRRDDSGQTQERPNYFDVDVYGAPADTVGRYTKKGSRVGVDGRLEWREWETEEGQRRQAVSVVADRVQFLDTPGAGRAADGSAEPGGEDQDTGERELVGAGTGDIEVSF
ncbi:MAG: single-stranded DNA-binding protein [Solirubrobacteraceae bacterium]